MARDGHREHGRIDITVLGRVNSAFDVTYVDERVQSLHFRRTEHRCGQRWVVVQLGHRHVLLRLQESVGIVLLDEANRSSEVEADRLLLMHLRHDLQRSHVHLLDLGRPTKAGH